jgi:hypothetical protein
LLSPPVFSGFWMSAYLSQLLETPQPVRAGLSIFICMPQRPEARQCSFFYRACPFLGYNLF